MFSTLRIVDSIKWSIAALLYAYIIYKAVTIGITLDEAHSYLLVKTNNINAMGATANTHWLNSLAMKLSLALPGDDLLWKLRILSMLCWPVYCYGAIRLSRLFANQWLGFVFFAVAVLNPYLLFYFSLSRGYAPACTFLILSLWQITRVLQAGELKPEKWLPAFLFAAIAVAANFTAFYFFMGLTIVYFFYLLFNKQIALLLAKPFQKLNILMAVVSVLAIASLLIIKYYGRDLDFGADFDPIGSLFGSFILNPQAIVLSNDQYGISRAEIGYTERLYHHHGLVLFGFFVAALVGSIVTAIKLKKVNAGSFATYVIFTVLFLSLMFSMLFKTLYLRDRSSLFLFPVGLVSLFFLADSLSRAKIITLLKNLSAAALLFLCSYNFYKAYNPWFFNELPLQPHTGKGLEALNEAKAKIAGMDIWFYAGYINYYSIAFPNRYHFKAELILLKNATTESEKVSLRKYDHLLLSYPYHDRNTALQNWHLKRFFPLSRAKLLARP